jgi:hypothetical protein
MHVLLDLGLLANFISGDAVLKAGLKPYLKKELYPLYVANGERMLNELIIKHKAVIKLDIQEY